MNLFAFAAEVAWRLLAIDYQKTLDDILCSPEFAAEFDRLAAEFSPSDMSVSSPDYRLAALSIRKRSKAARESASEKFSQWMTKRKSLPRVDMSGSLEEIEQSGVYLLCSDDVGFYAGESDNMREQIERILSNKKWSGLDPDSIKFVPSNEGLVGKYALKSALAIREEPPLNCRLLMYDSEFPRKPKRPLSTQG